MEGDVIETSADSWDTAAREGQKFISRNWARLLPATKTILAADGYDEYGRVVAGDDSMSDARHLEYALGVLAEAQAAKVPSKKGDEISSCFIGDDVLHQASELLARRFSCEPEFIGVAIRAVLKHQAASALQSLYFSGGTTETPTSSAIWGISKAIGKTVLLIGLPASIGGGLAYASEGNGVAASLCAYFAFAAVSTYRSRNEVTAAKELGTYWKWSGLLNRDFHVGTGHGLRVKLEEMIRQDIHVPSVLVDLCAQLHLTAKH